MMFTEDEAQDKACCATAARIEGGKIARGVCLGSACMAWRWEMGVFCLDKGRFLLPGETTTEPRSEMRKTDRGYCGIAGRPE